MRRILPLLLGLTLPVSAQAADTWTVDRNHSETSFQVRHLMSKVRGSFNEFTGAVVGDPKQPDQATVEFTIKTASIDTGVTNRDNHLKSPDFFDAEKFPEITFKSSRIVRKGDNQFDVTGTLSVHGVAKEVTLPVTLLGFQKDPQGKERAGFETAITLSRKDYGLLWNRALDNGGFLLGDEVWVNVNLEAIKKVEAAPSPQAK